MAKKDTVKPAVLPNAIRELFERVIAGDIAARNDWKAIATELVLHPKAKPVVHTTEAPTVDTERKGVRADQFAVMHCAKHVPREQPGTTAYKEARNAGQRAYNTSVVTALVVMGYWQRKQRSASSDGKSGDAVKSADVAVLAKQKPTDLAQELVKTRRELKDSQTRQGEKFGSDVMQCQYVVAELAKSVLDALVAFQSTKKLTKPALEAIGKVADVARKLQTSVKELGDKLITGTSPEQAADALAAHTRNVLGTTPTTAETPETEAVEA